VRGAPIDSMKVDDLILIIAFPKRDINKCPAIRLAVNRTHRVMGRMMLLVISISTMKFINGTGVPCGNRWESMWFVFFIHPNIMMASHMVRERGRVIGN
jgi:hypothetical protein